MFWVGQKVVCIDVGGNHFLSTGWVYTVARVHPGMFRALRDYPNHRTCDGIDLVGSDGGPFYADRFRPIVERKTDISIFTEMLTKANRPVVDRTEITEMVVETLRRGRNPKGTSNAV